MRLSYKDIECDSNMRVSRDLEKKISSCDCLGKTLNVIASGMRELRDLEKDTPLLCLSGQSNFFFLEQ